MLFTVVRAMLIRNMYRGRAGRVLGRVGSVRLYYSRDVAETLVDITAQNDIHHEHRLSPRYVSKSTENMRPIAPDRYMPACRKTRLHRVVRNLHLILLAPRERPGDGV